MSELFLAFGIRAICILGKEPYDVEAERETMKMLDKTGSMYEA
jgi:hypothetical protein